jgi:hypothetical protein
MSAPPGPTTLKDTDLDRSEVGYSGLKLRQLLAGYRGKVGTHLIVVRVAGPQSFDQFAKRRFTSGRHSLVLKSFGPSCRSVRNTLCFKVVEPLRYQIAAVLVNADLRRQVVFGRK